MLSKVVSKIKGVCTREPSEDQLEWMMIIVVLLIVGASVYALIQTKGELTAPIVAGLLLSIFTLVSWQFRSKIKELEDKVKQLSKKDDGIQ